MTHICVSELTIIGSDNGLSLGRRQAIIWSNDGILLIRPLGTNFGEISFGIQTSSLKKMHLKMSSAKWRPFCLSLNVLMMEPDGYIISWWRYDMERLSTLLALCEENQLVTGGFPAQKWQRLRFSLIWTWTNYQINSQIGNDLTCHDAHVMLL